MILDTEQYSSPTLELNTDTAKLLRCYGSWMGEHAH